MRRISWLLPLAALALALLPAIAPAQEPATPMSGYRGADVGNGYRGAFSDLAAEIDRYWQETFADAGAAYAPPGIVVVDRPMATGCGYVEPRPNAFYCPPDLAIYLVPSFLDDQQARFGDYAPIAVFAHEWGHHVQQITGIVKGPGGSKDHELQADCLTGAFTARADELGLLDAGDFIEALSSAIDAGDPTGLPEDHPGAHGTGEERIKSLTRGWGGGPVYGCKLPLVADGVPTGEPTPRVSAMALLPEPFFPGAEPCLQPTSTVAIDFRDMVDRLPDDPNAEAMLRSLGYVEGAVRDFACAVPPPGTPGWASVSVHVYEDAAGAQAAIPYLAEQRALNTQLVAVPPPSIGDAAAALVGPSEKGVEYTLYASLGPVLVRASAVAAPLAPEPEMEAAARGILDRAATAMATAGGGAAPMNATAPARATVSMPDPLPTSPPARTLFAADLLPTWPDVPNAGCFAMSARGTYRLDDVAPLVSGTGLGPAWRDGGYVDFSCARPAPGGARFVEAIVHTWSDPAAAAQAADLWQSSDAPAPTMARLCDSRGTVMACAVAIGVGSPPAADARALLAQVLAGAG